MQRNTYGDQFLPARRYQLSHDVSFCHNDRSSIETAGHIELVLAREGGFLLSTILPYSVFSGKSGMSGISRNKGTSLWNFVPNLGLRKFRHARRSPPTTCCQLSSTTVDA